MKKVVFIDEYPFITEEQIQKLLAYFNEVSYNPIIKPIMDKEDQQGTLHHKDILELSKSLIQFKSKNNLPTFFSPDDMLVLGKIIHLLAEDRFDLVHTLSNVAKRYPNDEDIFNEADIYADILNS